MATVSTEIKLELKSSGLWKSFISYRDSLKSDGFAPREALKLSLEEFMPKLEAWRSGGGVEMGVSASGDLGDRGISESDRCPGTRSPSSLDLSGCGDDEDYLSLRERRCGILESIEWVGENLDIPIELVKVKDAPSAHAWGMLISYRRNQVRKDEFWDKVYSRLIPNKSQLEGKGTFELDGQGIIDACARILGIKAAAECTEGDE